MKVTKINTDSTETSVELDLFDGRKLPTALKKKVAEEVGSYLVEQTLIAMSKQASPVQGEGKYKPLSKDYKKKKLEEVGSSEANLEYDGILKDELDFIVTKSGTLEVGVFGERALAADGHNNLSGRSKLPTRRFLPGEGQNYKKDIQLEVERIIADAVASEISIKPSKFRDISTKKELYEALANTFGPMSRSELSLIVFRNEAVYEVLNDLNLIGLL